MQLHFYLAFRHAVPPSDLRNGIRVPVSPKEDHPAVPGQAFQKCVQELPDLFAPQGPLVAGIGNAQLHFLGQGHHIRLSLRRQLPVQPVQGNVAADGGQKGKEIFWPVGWDDLPGFEIGIADAFLRVLPAQQDPVRQRMQPPAIGQVRLMDGVLVSGQKQRDDLCVVQCMTLLSPGISEVPHPCNKN